MRVSCLRIAVVSLAALLFTAPALADDKPASCIYVEVATLPVKYVGLGMEPTMPGSINGKPARMLMDTGAMVSGLTMGAAEKFGLSLAGTGQWVSGVGGDTRLYDARIDDITVGPTRSGRTTVRVIGAMGYKAPYDMIVGAKFLLQADLEMDLAGRQIKFFRPQNCKDSFLGYWTRDKVVVVPYEWRYTQGDNPHFKVSVNGHELDAMIDSGAESTVIELAAAREAGLRLDAPEVKHLADIAGVGEGRVEHWTARFDKLTIGDETIVNAQIGVMESHGIHIADLLLGRDFLRSHRVLFAKSQKKLYISYLPGTDAFVSHPTSIEPWLQREADEGNPDAELRLANWYGSGAGGKKDPALATSWLDRAAAHGQPRAQLAVGRRLMLRGRDRDAIAPLRAALDQLPDEYQGALWLYIARLRADQGAPARQELETMFKTNQDWPAPVARFYLGRLGADALFAQAAVAKTPELARRLTCASTAAVADLYAAQGNTAEAAAVLAAHPDCKLAPRLALAAPTPAPAAQ